MNPTDIIIGSVVVIVGTTLVREVRTTPNASTGQAAKMTFKPVLFGFALAVALLAIAIVAPNFAKGLALLGLVGAFVVNGPALFGLVGKLGK